MKVTPIRRPFFFFLAETARTRGKPLPWLAPELSTDVPRFARMFFREYYARLPQGAVLVFDNLQEFDWGGCGQLMEIAFDEVPAGVTIFALSRDAPPARLARLELNGRIEILDWSQLRLDHAEARALARIDDSAGPDAQVWLDRIDGWAAGAVMLREHIASARIGRDTVSDASLPVLDGRDTIFRYFAGEILDHMPPASQHLLLRLSTLPGMTAAEAQRLTGDPQAEPLLGRLFRDNLFVDRRGPAPYTYHFHALFREFLRHEAGQRLAPAERLPLLERAAEVLDAHGRVADAARLYHDAGAYSRLTGLLLRHARGMIATGRGQSWREWAGWLPLASMEAEPWLSYWLGSSLNQVDPVSARQALIRAEQVFRKAADVPARLLTIAAVIDSFLYEWADFHALPQWIGELQRGLAGLDLDTLDAVTDLKVHSRLTLALYLVDPGSPALPQSAQRAFQAVGRVDDPAEQLIAGTFLLDYFSSMDIDASRRLFVLLRHLADEPSIGPFYRIWWCRPASFQYQLEGDYRAARDMILHGKRLATDFGLSHLQCHFNARIVVEYLAVRDLASAASLLDEMRQTVAPARTHDLVYLRMLETSYLAQQGDMQAALRTAEEARQLSEEAAVGPRIRAQIHGGLACCCLQAGDFAAALRWSDKAAENTHGMDKAYAVNIRRFVQAYTALENGDSAGADGILDELFADLRRGEGPLSIVFACFPQLACALFVHALREGIEADYVRAVVARQGLPPPDRFTPNWPWPVTVRLLGKTEISLDGEVFAPAGKAQQRPMLLLKALVVAGDAGRMQQALATELWPDADDPKAALNVTVHRLRKLLGHDDSVVVTTGKIRLNEIKVWTDVSALAELCARVDQLPHDADAGKVRRLAVDLLGLYHGPLCDGDEEAWLLPARERWRSRFLAATVRLGQLLESVAEWPTAHRLYSRALEAEPLAENLYRSLMRCGHAQGDPSSALSAYRRCREMLSLVLGRPPAPETEKLAASLDLK